MEAVKIETFTSLSEAAHSILADKGQWFIEELLRKLLAEGVSQVSDLTPKAMKGKWARFQLGDLGSIEKLCARLSGGGSGGHECKTSSASGGDSGGRRREKRSRSPFRNDRRSDYRDSSRPWRGGRRDGGGSGGGWSSWKGRGGGRGMQQEKPELWAAVEAGNEALAKRLLDEGANPEDRFQGWTPLMKAAEENLPRICLALIEMKADVEAQNRKGRTPLSFAAAPSKRGQGAEAKERPTALEAMRVLLDHGALASRKDMSGSTARQRAEQEGREDAVQMLDTYQRQE